MSKATDQQLIAEVKANGYSVLRGFYLEQKMGYFRWARHNFDLPEEQLNDIYHDAMIILYENIRDHKIHELRSSLKTYFFAIAKNLALAEMRRENKTLTEKDSVSEHQRFLHKEEEKDERTEGIANLVQQMLGPCKELLTLFYYQKLSMEVISKKMNYKNANVAKSQKKRCLDKLKTLLSKNE